MSKHVSLDELSRLRAAAIDAMKDGAVDFNIATGRTSLVVDGVEVAHHYDTIPAASGAADSRVARAARALVSALDRTVPAWRQETLGQRNDSDEVNAAWDELVEAIQGGDGAG